MKFKPPPSLGQVLSFDHPSNRETQRWKISHLLHHVPMGREYTCCFTPINNIHHEVRLNNFQLCSRLERKQKINTSPNKAASKNLDFRQASGKVGNLSTFHNIIISKKRSDAIAPGNWRISRSFTLPGVWIGHQQKMPNIVVEFQNLWTNSPIRKFEVPLFFTNKIAGPKKKSTQIKQRSVYYQTQSVYITNPNFMHYCKGNTSKSPCITMHLLYLLLVWSPTNLGKLLYFLRVNLEEYTPEN